MAEQQQVKGILVGDKGVMLVVALDVTICGEVILKRCPRHKGTLCLVSVSERIHIQVTELSNEME